MATSSGRVPRLYIDEDLSSEATFAVTSEQANYLLRVLRLSDGAPVLVFNGRDGEWRATITSTSKREAVLQCRQQTWPQSSGPDIHYLFAPLKRARLDYMAQKATELGVRALRPVATAYTQPERLNMDRLRANAIEAAEQCGMVSLPDIWPMAKLVDELQDWNAERHLIFCDEAAPIADPIASLKTLEPGPKAVLIGPEGGFSPAERSLLLSKPFVLPLSLGPRIMRSDTAAIAALALVNVVHGDWR